MKFQLKIRSLNEKTCHFGINTYTSNNLAGKRMALCFFFPKGMKRYNTDRLILKRVLIPHPLNRYLLYRNWMLICNSQNMWCNRKGEQN